jgi:hypothetical protein
VCCGNGGQVLNCASMTWPNTYEASSCQETHDPCERIFRIFSAVCMPAQSSVGLVSDLISVFGCQPTWLHHTLIEVPSPLLWRLQSRVAGILCDLEMIPCPRTVLLNTPG